MPAALLITTSAIPPVADHDVLGLVSAACVLSRSIIKDLGAALKNTTGGELTTYSSLLDKAFDITLARLEEKAHALGAEGIFGLQMACPQIAGGAAEVLLIGTAYRRHVASASDSQTLGS